MPIVTRQIESSHAALSAESNDAQQPR